jgi:elongation factor Tu
VTGAIEAGRVRVGDAAEVIGLGVPLSTVVTGVETFGKTMERAEAGDQAALLLRGVRRSQVRRGQVVAAPGTLTAHARFTARVFQLPAAEGGRQTPVGTGYRPQFLIRTASVSGMLDLGEAGSARPGEQVAVAVEPGKPVALGSGLGFVMREGGKTVGAGTVTSVPG